jgi:hypothetical protein
MPRVAFVDRATPPKMRVGTPLVYGALVSSRALNEYLFHKFDIQVGIFLIRQNAVVSREPRYDQPLHRPLPP